MCAICLVYGAHTTDDRRAIWEELKNVRETVNIPMLFLGDFDEVQRSKEKKVEWHKKQTKESEHDSISMGGILKMGRCNMGGS